MKLEVVKIRIDGGTQPRAELQVEVMDEYAEQMRAGAEFPPVTVFFDGKDYWLADGFHRLGAHLRAFGDNTSIDADVIQGTQSDAQWYSLSVNKTHGLRRTNEDKIRAVKAALAHEKNKCLSDAAIADHVGVHRETVLKYRHETEAHLSKTDKSDTPELTSHLSKTDKSTHRTGRDGRTISTAKIGKGAQNKAKRGGHRVRISRNAHSLRLGHSDPCPMIPLQFSPNNPGTAAATLWQYFSRSFIEALVAELTQRLSAKGDPV